MIDNNPYRSSTIGKENDLQYAWNNVVLVDRHDQAIGQTEKLYAHQNGLLHRAFSIFIFDSKGNMLLQQRANSKYHGAGLWTNTCCSHPQWEEDVLESATRRLAYEMGIHCKIAKEFEFIYHTEVENGLIEHEYDHVFFGISDQLPTPNPQEVQNYQWIGMRDLLNHVSAFPENYTYWFKSAIPKILQILERNKS